METVITVVETDKSISNNEALPLDEASTKAERCIKIGIVAIVCADCPMARFCAVKAEAAQAIPEQLIDEPTPKAPDSNIEDNTEQNPLQKIETENIVQLRSSEINQPPKTTYLERLMDDNIAIVIANSLSGESGSSARVDDLQQKNEEVYAVNNTINKKDVSKPVNDLPLPKKISFEKNETINDDIEKESAVTFDEPGHYHQVTTPLVNKEKPENIAVPVKEEVLNIIPDVKPTISEVYFVPETTTVKASTSVHEEILSVVTEKISSPVINIAEIALPIFKSEVFQKKAEVDEDKNPIRANTKLEIQEPIIYSDELAESGIREQIEEIFSDSLIEMTHDDVQPEKIVVEEYYTNPVADEPDSAQKTRHVKRDHKIEEEIEIDVAELEIPIIDSDDTIDPEFRLSSSPAATVSISVSVLRRLAILVFYQVSL